MSSDLRKLGKSSAIYALGDFLTKGAKFLLVPFYIHFMPQEDVGTLALLQAVTVFLAAVLSFGLPGAVTRFYVEYDEAREADRYVAGLWWMRLLIASVFAGGLVALVVGLDVRFFDQIPATLMVLAIVSGWLNSCFEITLARYMVREEPLRHRMFSFSQFLATTAVVIVLVAGFGMGIDGVMWGQVVTYGVWAVGSAVIVTKPAGIGRLSLARVRESFAFSLPLVPHRLFQWALSLSDRLILERFVTLAALAVYSVGYQMGSILTIFTLAMNNAWMPRYLRSSEDAAGRAAYARMTTYFCGATFGTALLLVLFAPEAIALVGTKAYDGAAALMAVVAFSYVFQALYLVAVGPLFYLKKTEWVPVVTLVAALANVGFNLLAIPRYGVMAAAVGTGVGYLVMAVCAFVVGRRYYRVTFEYGRIAGMGALATAIGAAGWLWLGSDVSVSAFALKGGLVLLGAVGVLVTPVVFTRGERAGLRERLWHAFHRKPRRAAAERL